MGMTLVNARSNYCGAHAHRVHVRSELDILPLPGVPFPPSSMVEVRPVRFCRRRLRCREGLDCLEGLANQIALGGPPGGNFLIQRISAIPSVTLPGQDRLGTAMVTAYVAAYRADC